MTVLKSEYKNQTVYIQKLDARLDTISLTNDEINFLISIGCNEYFEDEIKPASKNIDYSTVEKIENVKINLEDNE